MGKILPIAPPIVPRVPTPTGQVSSRPTRYRRGGARPQVQLRERDARFIETVLQLGAIRTVAALLLWLSLSEGGAPVMHFFKRIVRLFRGGYLTKVAVAVSRAMTGSQQDVYIVEGGLAQAWIEAGRPLDQADPAIAVPLRKQASADRDRLLQLFTGRGLDPDFVTSKLKLHSEQARAALLARQNLLDHSCLTSDFVAAVMYGCRYNPEFTFGDLRGDGQVNLTIAVSHHGKAHKLYREPDAFFVMTHRGERHAHLVEAESGSSARKRIIEKVTAYCSVQQSLS